MNARNNFQKYNENKNNFEIHTYKISNFTVILKVGNVSKIPLANDITN